MFKAYPETYQMPVYQTRRSGSAPQWVYDNTIKNATKMCIRDSKYGAHEPLLFVGHYWRRGKPAPIRANLACLDYSAVVGGRLVAYRLDQETRLDAGKFVWVDVDPQEAPR